MLNPHHASLEGLEGAAPEASGGDVAANGPARGKSPRPPRPPGIRDLGFRATGEGREYSLQVLGEGEPRLFLFFIAHQTFASRQLSFQDAPDLCYSRMQSDLIADPDLLPGSRREPTPDEMLEYHLARKSPASGRRRRAPVVPDQGAIPPFSRFGS